MYETVKETAESYYFYFTRSWIVSICLLICSSGRNNNNNNHNDAIANNSTWKERTENSKFARCLSPQNNMVNEPHPYIFGPIPGFFCLL